MISLKRLHSWLYFFLDSGFYSEAPQGFLPDDMCSTTEWTGWSECSTTCGKGYELRTRRFSNRMGRKKCPHVDTTERRSCAGIEPTCPEDPDEKRILASPDCAVTSWSEWSPCSVSCGKLIQTTVHNSAQWKLKPLSVTTNVYVLQTDDPGHEGQKSSAQVARVVGLQTDAVVVTETRFRYLFNLKRTWNTTKH